MDKSIVNFILKYNPRFKSWATKNI